mgnify:CR=1 FL=1
MDDPTQNDVHEAGKEQETLALLARGLGIGEVADALFVSRNTARKHVQSVLVKLGAHIQLEAVAIARRMGLVRDDDSTSI